jgi:EmrB/QacA subfamily drug resistance transporter
MDTRSTRRNRSVGSQLPGLLLAMFLGAVDLTIMAPALPAVAGQLGGLSQIPVVVTAYLLAATVMMPIYGKLGDRFGRKPVLLVSIGIFVTGAVACGFAGTMAGLAAFRAVQGLGGGGLSIGAQAIIGEIVSPRERGRYLGYIGAVYVLAAVGGPLLGGLVIDLWGWRAIFACYVPLGALAAATVAFTLRLPRPDAHQPVDYLGAASLALAVAGIVLVGATRDAAYLALAVAGTAGWWWTARHAADPILPRRLFRMRGFSVPIAVSFVIGFALFGVVSYLPTFFQVVDGLSATRAGLVLTALLAGVLVSTVWSGRRITRTGRYKPYPVVGTALAAMAIAGLALTLQVGADLAAPVLMVAIGLGIGLVMQVMVLVAQNATDHADLGVATSSVTFFRQIGGSLGAAAIGTALVPHGVAAAETLAARMPVVLVALAPMLAIAFVLTLALPVLPLRESAYVDEAT